MRISRLIFTSKFLPPLQSHHFTHNTVGHLDSTDEHQHIENQLAHMRNRTEEINVRVYKTEKNTIRRKAKKCGMNMSEYLRSLGTGAAVREAPRQELMLAYQKLTTLHDTVRYELAMRDFDEALTEIESLLLRAYHGKEDADGGDEDLGDP